MKFRDFSLAEEKNDTAVMTFGRFQPITSAHETLIKQVGSLAKEKGAHPFVFTSRKSGDKKNPLDFNTKSDMLRKHYGVNVPDSEEINNPFQAAQHLGKLGYKNVHLVLGGDRIKDIGGMIKKYMGHEDPEKRINISNLTLHSAGERSANPVSGTAVRAAARSGNVKEFQRMIAPSLGKESTETIYRVLRGEQQLGESLDKPFPTTYRSKEKLDGGKRHYFDFEVPPIDTKSRLPELSKPTKGKVEFNPRTVAGGEAAKEGHYEVSFDVGGETKTTGKGDAGRILSTVKSAVKQFMKMKPDAKSFKAIIIDGDQFKKDSDGNIVKDKDGKSIPSGRAKLYKRLANHFAKEYGFDVDVNMKQGRFRGTRKGETPVDISSSIPANLRPSSAFAESLDNPFPTTYTKDRSYDEIEHHYGFEIPPEGEQKKVKKGKVMFSQAFGRGRGHYDLVFDVDDQSTPTGAGNTTKIFSTVLSAVDQHMKKYPKTKGIEAIIPTDDEYKITDKGKKVPSGRSKLYTRLANLFGKKYVFDVEVDDDGGGFRGTRKKASKLAEGIRQAFSFEDPEERDRRKQTEQEKQDFEDFKKKQNPDKIEGESLRDLLRKAGVKKPVSKRTGLGSTKLVGVKDPKTGKIVIKQVFANESLGEEANPRIPRKKGQPAKSKKHSDLYTDEDPKGTIHGLGFKNASVARASVKKIESSDRSHAHKIQAAVAMEQRARVANKDAAAAIYRRYIDRNKKSD